MCKVTVGSGCSSSLFTGSLLLQEDNPGGRVARSTGRRGAQSAAGLLAARGRCPVGSASLASLSPARDCIREMSPGAQSNEKLMSCKGGT